MEFCVSYIHASCIGSKNCYFSVVVNESETEVVNESETVVAPAFAESVTEGDIRWEKGIVNTYNCVHVICPSLLNLMVCTCTCTHVCNWGIVYRVTSELCICGAFVLCLNLNLKGKL